MSNQTPPSRQCFVSGCGKPDVNAPNEGTWPTCSQFPPACSEHLYLVPRQSRRLRGQTPPSQGWEQGAIRNTQQEVACRHCGEDIRLMDGSWLDRETHSTCDQDEAYPARKHEPIDQSDDAALVTVLTAIVREADQAFQRSGGSSRHWVRDCFLPHLNASGVVVSIASAHAAADRQIAELKEALRSADEERHFANARVVELEAAEAQVTALTAQVEMGKEAVVRWRQEADEGAVLRNKMGDILSRTVVALRGPEPELTRWSWHDLPERAQQLRGEVARHAAQARDISLWLAEAGCEALPIPEGVKWLLQRAEHAEGEVARLTQEKADHSQCHDVVCNGDHTKPRGAKGVSCSCKGRDGAYQELQQLRQAHEHLTPAIEQLLAFADAEREGARVVKDRDLYQFSSGYREAIARVAALRQPLTEQK